MVLLTALAQGHVGSPTYNVNPLNRCGFASSALLLEYILHAFSTVLKAKLKQPSYSSSSRHVCAFDQIKEGDDGGVVI